MSGKFRLAHGSVVVSVKLLPQALHLGIGRRFGHTQLAVVIGVESRERSAGSRTRTRASSVAGRRSALVVRFGAAAGRGLAPRNLARRSSFS